jgi:hypothetical protein
MLNMLLAVCWNPSVTWFLGCSVAACRAATSTLTAAYTLVAGRLARSTAKVSMTRWHLMIQKLAIRRQVGPALKSPASTAFLQVTKQPQLKHACCAASSVCSMLVPHHLCYCCFQHCFLLPLCGVYSGTYWDKAGGCLRGTWVAGNLKGQAQYDQPHYHFEGQFAKGLPAGKRPGQ